MKKITLLLCSICCAFMLSAQIHKGVVLVGGNAGVSHVSTSLYNLTSINITPRAIYFFGEHLGLGGAVSLGLTTGDYRQTSIGVSPEPRYYFNKNGNARFFAMIDIGLESIMPKGSKAYFNYYFNPGLGVDFFLNDRVAIEGVLGYFNGHSSINDYAVNTLGLQFGVAAFIGGGQ